MGLETTGPGNLCLCFHRLNIKSNHCWCALFIQANFIPCRFVMVHAGPLSMKKICRCYAASRPGPRPLQKHKLLQATFVWDFAKDVEGKTCQKGDEIKSQKFSLLGVPDLQMSLYPQGHTKSQRGPHVPVPLCPCRVADQVQDVQGNVWG